MKEEIEESIKQNQENYINSEAVSDWPPEGENLEAAQTKAIAAICEIMTAIHSHSFLLTNKITNIGDICETHAPSDHAFAKLYFNALLQEVIEDDEDTANILLEEEVDILGLLC